MPNWTWWQYLFLGYLIGCASVTLCAWLFGHKKAPDDAGTSEPEQTNKDSASITWIEDLRKGRR